MTMPVILLVATYILNIVDYQQTIYAIQFFGTDIEANPIGRFMLENDLAWVFKMIVVPMVLIAIGFIVKIDRKQIWGVYFLFAAYLILVIHNFIMLAQSGIF